MQLYYRLYLGGVVPVGSLRNKPDVGTIRPFVGCVRELQFNERTIELSGRHGIIVLILITGNAYSKLL